MSIFNGKNKKEDVVEISKSDLKGIADLLHKSSIFLNQGLCDHFDLSELYDLNTKYRKGEIKKKEVLRKLDICFPHGIRKPEKVTEVQIKCDEKYEELMKKIDSYFSTAEETRQRWSTVFKNLVDEGGI